VLANLHSEPTVHWIQSRHLFGEIGWPGRKSWCQKKHQQEDMYYTYRTENLILVIWKSWRIGGRIIILHITVLDWSYGWICWFPLFVFTGETAHIHYLLHDQIRKSVISDFVPVLSLL